MDLSPLFFTLLGFLLGSIPFSLILPRWFRGTDVRRFGDGNPGAANAFKSGGRLCGVLALLLDFFKGGIPVLLAKYFHQIDGLWLIPVAIAPVAGHAYSPFLGFRGGKAITTTFGIWTGLTLFQAPFLLGVFCAAALYFIKPSAWATVLAFVAFWVACVFIRMEAVLLIIGLINFLIILHKHFPELKQPIIFRYRQNHG
jgi:acyl phosphate:glycerol-3-phosphate acyltransferase